MSTVNLRTPQNTPVPYTFTAPYLSYYYTISSQALHGTATVSNTEDSYTHPFEYTPAPGYRGADDVLVEVRDLPPEGGDIFIDYIQVSIMVYGQPTINPPLANQTVAYQQPAKTMTANGSADVLTYTWYVDGVQVQGPSSSNILSVSASQYTVGTHTVRVVATNEAGSTESTATLTVQGQTRPATYVDTGVSETASGGCLVSAGGGSEAGRWSAAPTIQLIDPSGANTVASVAAAYNALMWALRDAKLLAADQQIWFDEEPGQAGAGFTITNSANQVLHTGSYVPYPSGSPVKYLSVQDVVDGLNAAGALNSAVTGVRFVYDGARITLVVPPNKNLLISDRTGTRFGSAERVLNRVCYGAVQYVTAPNGDVSYAPIIGAAYEVPDDALTPLSGIAQIPNGVTNLSVTGFTDTTASLIWIKIPNVPSDPPGFTHYIKVLWNGGQRYLLNVSNTYTVTGLSAGISYVITVGTKTDYEICLDEASISVTTNPDAPQIFTFTYYDPNTELYYTGLGWDFVNSTYFIEFYDGNGTQVSTFPINTTSSYDEFGSTGYVPIPAFSGATDVKAKYYIFNGPTKVYVTPFSETIQYPSPSPSPGGE